MKKALVLGFVFAVATARAQLPSNPAEAVEGYCRQVVGQTNVIQRGLVMLQDDGDGRGPFVASWNTAALGVRPADGVFTSSTISTNWTANPAYGWWWYYQGALAKYGGSVTNDAATNLAILGSWESMAVSNKVAAIRASDLSAQAVWERAQAGINADARLIQFVYGNLGGVACESTTPPSVSNSTVAVHWPAAGTGR